MNFKSTTMTLLATSLFAAGCAKAPQSSAPAAQISAAALNASASKASPGVEPVITGAQVAVRGNPMSFDIALPDGMTLTMASWDFGDGSINVNNLGSVAHVYAQPGQYSISVVAFDQNDSIWRLSYTANVIGFFDGLSCITVTAVSAPYDAVAGQPVDMRVTIPACFAGSVTSIEWNFGDGTGAGNGDSVSPTFSAGGTFQQTVSIFAPQSTSGPFLILTQTIHVSSPAPTPSPVPTPIATPVPTPVATPVPTPVATPVPTPVATPQPTPVPHGGMKKKHGDHDDCARGRDGKKHHHDADDDCPRDHSGQKHHHDEGDDCPRGRDGKLAHR